MPLADKFQKNDAYKCICFPCTVQIYNFYIFRARSIDNEKNLPVSTIENVKVKSHKIEIPDVEDLPLPNVEEIKESLVPWLISKQKCCATKNNEDLNRSDGNTNDIRNESINTDNSGPERVENSTQCNSVQNFDKETQIQPSVTEIFTQTHKTPTRFAQIQCDLAKRNQNTLKKANKECATQNEAANSKRSVHIQCQLTKRIQKTSKSEGREMATQTVSNSVDHSNYESELAKLSQKSSKKISDSVNQSVQCEIMKTNKKTATNKVGEACATQTDSNSINHSDRENERIKLNMKSLKKISHIRNRSIQCEIIKTNKRTVTKRGGIESATQTKSNCSSSSGLLIQNDERKVLKSNQKIPEKESRDSTTQTELKCDNQGQSFKSPKCEQCRELYTKDSIKSDLLSVKEELDYPQSLSPIKSLSINVDGTRTEIKVSPTHAAVSPRSSGLLTIQNRIQHVIICPQCDKTTYSKTEYRLHKKMHMICNFCKKRFTSIKRTKMHIESDCKVQKLIKPEPVVPLIRLEYSKDIQKKYPINVKRVSELSEKKINEGKDFKKFRLRSRSMSNVDNVYNDPTSCKCRISIISGISVGVDKSVQTNFLFEKQLVKTPLDYFCENLFLKRNRKSDKDNNLVPTKKLKLS